MLPITVYHYGIGGGGFGRACEACYMDAITEGREADDVPDFTETAYTPQEAYGLTCDGCGRTLNQAAKEDA